MKQILLKILKGILILSVLLLLILLVFGLVLLIGWPWWVGFFFLLGLVGLFLGVLVFRKILKRRREQMFVHQIIEQDDAAYRKLAPKEKDTAKELQARWKEAIEALRKSHLRKYGNPLYVLPWYMVIGESGSGKTTAIESARLTSPFASVSRTSGISGTRNCDWWFFDEAILIDTAGRYAIPVDEGRDKEEWQRFLSLLSKFRKKEPLNGLVITVAADRLTQTSAEALQEDGLSIRRRIDELMLTLGARFPVYTLVTKCDLIQGATHFCDSLPQDALNQAMGEMNRDLKTDLKAFMSSAFSNVNDRLRDYRLLLLNKPDGRSDASGMLLFPEEFEKLKEPLTAFIEGVFQDTPYQETPLLRGLYFSSGRQEGTPYSHFLNALGLIQGGEVLAGTNKGLFLHDLFAKILPKDRKLFMPTHHMARWRTLTRNMGLTAWIAIMVAACGLLSYAFVKNLNALSEVRLAFKEKISHGGGLLEYVSTMESRRQALLEVEKDNRHWWIPRLGLNESLKIESGLKEKFVEKFRSGFLNEFDDTMYERVGRYNAQSPSLEFGAHVVHLVRRINLLKSRVDGNGLDTLSAMPQPVYHPAVLHRADAIPEIREMIGTQYLYATAWEKDRQALSDKLAMLQTNLNHLLTLKGVTLKWLTAWVNDDPSLDPVGMHDFWGGEPNYEVAVVPASFTKIGQKKIKGIMADIEAALPNPLIITGQKLEFNKWYTDTYAATWQRFGRSLDNGKDLLAGRDQWQAVAKTLNTIEGPYYAFIDRVVDEFEDFDKKKELPIWIALAQKWQLIRKESKASDVIDPEKSGIIKKAKRGVKAKLYKAEKALGTKFRVSLDPKSRLKAAKIHLAYQKGLDESVSATASRNVAFKMASDTYTQDPATGESPILSAQRALNGIIGTIGDSTIDDEALFWDVLRGNIRFMRHYISREAACVLQDRWERDVLLEVRDVSANRDMGQLMMGSNGYAAKFLEGPAAPFIARSYEKGYFPKKIQGGEIPFDKTLLVYLTKSARAAKPKRNRYKVKIRAYPTGANRNAQLLPQATLLELQCGEKQIRLQNFNAPAAKTFTWSPSDCGDVNFQISVGNLILTKTYTGHNAFAKFLDEFKKGSRIFYREEFPSEEAALKRLDIKYIKAKYQFQGHQPALQWLYSAPGMPPRRIAACWDQ